MHQNLCKNKKYLPKKCQKKLTIHKTKNVLILAAQEYFSKEACGNEYI